MPAVLRFKGLRVVIYPNDHSPPHVHIVGGRRWAKFFLNCWAGPVELHEQQGFRQGELKSIARVLNENLALLCEEWRKIHGEP